MTLAQIATAYRAAEHTARTTAARNDTTANTVALMDMMDLAEMGERDRMPGWVAPWDSAAAEVRGMGGVDPISQQA